MCLLAQESLIQYQQVIKLQQIMMNIDLSTFKQKQFYRYEFHV